MQMVEAGKHGETKEDTILETPGTYETRQLHIGDEEGDEEEDNNHVVEGEGGENPLQLDELEDEDKGLTEDELQHI